MATEAEVKKSLERLSAAFTIYNKDPEAIRAFIRIVVEKLTQFPAFIIDRAMEKIIETQSFFPKINEMMVACYGQRDEAMQIINNKFQTFKDDWHVNIIHSLAEWETLKDEYLKLGSKISAAAVMESYKNYGKLYTPVSPERIAETKKKLANLAEQFGNH